MRRIEIGEKKADGDRLDPLGFQQTGGGNDAALIERLEFLAVRRTEPAFHHFAVPPLDQGPVLPRQLLHDRIVFDALMARDVDDVAESFVGEHAGARALVLQHRVGGGGRAVQQVVDLGRRDAVVAADFGNALEDAARWIVGRGGDLVNGDLIGAQIAKHDVGKRTANIDTDRFHDACSFSRSEGGDCEAAASFKRASVLDTAAAKTRNPRRMSASLVFSLMS